MTSRRPCRLHAGDLRRVPTSPDKPLVGYHVACPACGAITVAVHGDDGQAITESTGPGGRPVVSFALPVQCVACHAGIAIDRNVAVVERPE